MKTLTFIVLACLVLAVPSIADTIIVDVNGSGDYDNILDAIDNSSSGDTIEVWEGIYHEQINFNGKAITITSTDPDNINVVYATTIDADNAGNAVTFDSGEDETSKLIGLTIQNGNDKGIYCYYSDPLISKCLLRFNGYGIFGSYAEPDIIDCIVRENSIRGIQDCDGEIANCEVVQNASTGIYDCSGGIINCTISSNSGNGLGQCGGVITGCTVIGNSGDGFGHCNAQIDNCVVSGNSVYGVYLNGPGGSITNCTVVGNKSSGLYLNNFSVELTNNIVAKNWEYGITDGGNATLKYNNVWGNLSGNYSSTPPGETDTHEDPLFATNGYWDVGDVWVEGDYYLKSIAGRWNPNAHTWVNDDVTSLCIDAGDPIGGCIDESSPNGGKINQGAYGGTEKASRSPWGIEPYCSEYPAGDVNFDCKVDFIDFAVISSNWLECNLVPQSACSE